MDRPGACFFWTIGWFEGKDGRERICKGRKEKDIQRPDFEGFERRRWQIEKDQQGQVDKARYEEREQTQVVYLTDLTQQSNQLTVL